MNILYISHLTNAISQGPNYSVPAQVKAQSQYDKVFWWNVSSAKQEFWLKDGLFHGLEEYPKLSLSFLPEPFSAPDIVVFECFYYSEYLKLSSECRKKKIPYIIVPRSAFTKQGQAQHRIKKLLGNFFLFRKFYKGASAIHYLSQKEYEDSGSSWSRRHFIIPNGCEIHKNVIVRTNHSGWLEGISIGRFDPYQKGLDLLFEACKNLKEYMKEHKIRITLYGPERQGYKAEYKKYIIDNGLQEIIQIDEREGVFGDSKEETLTHADFFIMTSRFEGMPMSMVEALCYGLPCIASNGTNMGEFLSDYNAGFVCDVTARSIEEAIVKMSEHREELSIMSSNAVKLSYKFEWNSIAMESRSEYQRIINGD